LTRRLAGAACLVVAAVSLRAQPATRLLHVCHAGSLQAAFAEVEKAFAAQHFDVSIDDVSGGSVTLARRLATGTQACDVYASADYMDIDLMLKPAGIADYTVIFARGGMVLAYLASDPSAQGVAAAGDFHPPATVPDAAANWYQKLLAPGVRIAGAHPFLDPGGYRAHMMLDLTERLYGVPGLYNALLEHYMTPASGTMGKDYSFQFIYEHSAAAAALRNPAYRYVHLPDGIDLSDSTKSAVYAQASVTIPGLGSRGAAPFVTIPATRTAWGLTIPRKSANVADAIAFVNLLLGPTGTDALNANGPTPLTPAAVSRADSPRVPRSLKGVAIE
jgi:molybdate/tungstate transport system substrate-binding protein